MLFFNSSFSNPNFGLKVGKEVLFKKNRMCRGADSVFLHDPSFRSLFIDTSYCYLTYRKKEVIDLCEDIKSFKIDSMLLTKTKETYFVSEQNLCNMELDSGSSKMIEKKPISSKDLTSNFTKIATDTDEKEK